MEEWNPNMDEAPQDDGVMHLRGLWVYSASTRHPIYFDVCAGYLQCGEFLAADHTVYGWRPEDYTHWMPLPPPPSVGAE